MFTNTDFQDTILPAMEKALLRSPEYALPGKHFITFFEPTSLTTTSCE